MTDIELAKWLQTPLHWHSVARTEVQRVVDALVALLREADVAVEGAMLAADELMTEFVSKQRAAHWGRINSGLSKAERLRARLRAVLGEGR